MISAGSQLPPTPQNAPTTSAPTPDAFLNPQSLPKTSVLSVLHCPIAHRRGDPHGQHLSLPTLTVEGSTQAESRQEKSLKSSRISNVLHAKASPKAGKAAARKDRYPFPTSHLVHPSTSAQGGRQWAAPEPAPSSCSVAHPTGARRRISAWHQRGQLPACRVCSLKQAVKHR